MDENRVRACKIMNGKEEHTSAEFRRSSKQRVYNPTGQEATNAQDNECFHDTLEL